jgi:Smr domain
VEDASWPSGRVVAVRETVQDAAGSGPRRLERGPLTLFIVVDGLPVSDLPAGARLRLGVTAVVALMESGEAAGPSASRGGFHGGGLLEATAGDPVPAEVLDPGDVAPGDGVSLEAIALPVTEVLDLHSFRPQDTQQVVIEYLAAARRAGLDEVRIVHGRGQGVQRAIVRRILGGAPDVAGFADAPPTRGGWGATLVRLYPTEDPQRT